MAQEGQPMRIDEGEVRMDEEMRALVRAMNRRAFGMSTIDSCFGHPRSERLNHQSQAFVGFTPSDVLSMRRFWRSFWRTLGREAGLTTYTWAKPPWANAYLVQFSVCKLDPVGLSPHGRLWPGGFFRVHIMPMHNPGNARGRKEKLYGIKLLRAFCRSYVAGI
jgi:hypothetical protein